MYLAGPSSKVNDTSRSPFELGQPQSGTPVANAQWCCMESSKSLT